MNKRIIGIAITLLAVAMLASPVMAIGPLNAEKVANNPHLTGDANTGLVFMTEVAGNTFMWFNNPSSIYFGMIYHDADTTIGEGRINNAIIVDLAIFSTITGNPEYCNKWLYFSNEPLQALGGHSILWALGQYAMGGQGDLLVANHPNGIYAMWHFVK
jgi:hypothetical protein